MNLVEFHNFAGEYNGNNHKITLPKFNISKGWQSQSRKKNNNSLFCVAGILPNQVQKILNNKIA